MRKVKRIIWLLPVLLAMLVTSCLKDDLNQTIVLLGTESDVKTIEQVIPDTLMSFITDTMAMQDSVLILPDGNLPPDIQGEFMFFPRDLYRNNGYPGPKGDTLFIRFGGDQGEIYTYLDSVHYAPGDSLFLGADTILIHADTVVLVEDTIQCYPQGQHNKIVPCDIKESNLPLASADAYVMGKDDQFTAYFTVSYDNDGNGNLLTRGYILTGTITPAGIDKAIMACVNIECSDSNQKDAIFIYRVKTDNSEDNRFGSAVRQKWYPNN
jgi:hypothetical protein